MNFLKSTAAIAAMMAVPLTSESVLAQIFAEENVDASHPSPAVSQDPSINTEDAKRSARAMPSLPRRDDAKAPITGLTPKVHRFRGAEKFFVTGSATDDITVFGTVDPEDVLRPDKTPIQKLRDILIKVPLKRGIVVRDYVAADGRRIAEIIVNGKIVCVESRAGQIDSSEMGKGGMVMHPTSGNGCY